MFTALKSYIAKRAAFQLEMTTSLMKIYQDLGVDKFQVAGAWMFIVANIAMGIIPFILLFTHGFTLFIELVALSLLVGQLNAYVTMFSWATAVLITKYFKMPTFSLTFKD